MIHSDDEIDPYIEFEWFYVTGLKMGFTTKQIGRMTVRKFTRFHNAYKRNFDLELSLRIAQKTYAKLEEEYVDNDDWIK